MQLIVPLASTNADAPSGTAEFYEYSASDPYGTPAVVYDENGVALGTSRTLDANGSVVCYAKGRTRVRVKTAAGVALRNYVVWNDDASITVESSNFTGTDPETGAQTAGMPLLLRAAWNLLKTSFGAVNGKVRITGGTADQYLKDALAGLRATNFPLFNVKDPIYGAVGDGTTDDGPAIQAAITAASVSGGIVFFPAGIYRTVQALSCTSAKVSFLGVGALGSVIRGATAGNVTLTVNGGSGNTALTFIKGIMFDHASTGTTWALQIIATIGMHVEDVRITGYYKGINAQSRVTLTNCRITTSAGGTDEPISFTSSAAGSVVRGGSFVAAGVTAGASVINVDVVNVVIDGASIITPGGGSSTYGVDVSAAGCRVVNCSFDTTAAGGLDFAMNLTADVDFHEDNNRMVSTTIAYPLVLGGLTYTKVFAGSRLQRHATYAAAASATVNVDKHTHFAVANANFTWNINASGSATTAGIYIHGAEIVLTVYNSTGGNITESWGTGNQRVSAPGNLAAGATRTRTLRFDSGLNDWIQIGNSVDVT